MILITQVMYKTKYILHKILKKNPFIKKLAIYIRYTLIPLGLSSVLKPFAMMMSIFRIRFLPFGTDMIGHLAGEPDCYLKEIILGKEQKKYIEIILAPADTVANDHLLGYWKRYFYIIKSPFICKLLKQITKDSSLTYDISTYFYHEATTCKPVRCYQIYDQYGSQQPILQLSQHDNERGNRWLRSMGVPDNAWFVAIHARDDSFHPSRKDDQSFRDSDIRSYHLAIKAITEKGGWCIRVGKNRKDKLDYINQLIESELEGEKNEWLDVFLCSKANFFLGSSSGLLMLPTVFGTPTVCVNVAPMTVFPFGHRDLSIPKLVYSNNESRCLNFCEILELDIANANSSRYFERLNLTLINNSSEEIRDIAIEMMELLDGSIVYDGCDYINQEKFKHLIKPHHYGYGYKSRIGKDFLKKYNSLLSNPKI